MKRSKLKLTPQTHENGCNKHRFVHKIIGQVIFLVLEQFNICTVSTVCLQSGFAKLIVVLNKYFFNSYCLMSNLITPIPSCLNVRCGGHDNISKQLQYSRPTCASSYCSLRWETFLKSKTFTFLCIVSGGLLNQLHLYIRPKLSMHK